MFYSIERNIHTERLEELIDAEFDMVSVPVRIDKRAEERNCYANVAMKVKACGGNIQFGWSVYQSPIMCEAQHHAVWENDQEELIDITPHSFGSNRILFIPDNRITYEGRNIDSVRMNITNNPIVDDFIVLAEMQERILANAKRTDKNKVILIGATSRLYNKYMQIGKEILLFVLAGNSQTNNCFCNSGKIYRECHGLGLVEMINVDRLKLPNDAVRLFVTSPGASEG